MALTSDGLLTCGVNLWRIDALDPDTLVQGVHRGPGLVPVAAHLTGQVCFLW